MAVSPLYNDRLLARVHDNTLRSLVGSNNDLYENGKSISDIHVVVVPFQTIVSVSIQHLMVFFSQRVYRDIYHPGN